MKDSHGQTVHGISKTACQCGHPRSVHVEGVGPCHNPEACFCAEFRYNVPADDFQEKAAQLATIVQDYRDYTEREILLGILDFSRRTGWGDPANLGHWLGAAQRWALKERVRV